MSTELTYEEICTLMLKDYPDVLLTEDVCKVLRVCRQTVYNLVLKGKLKTIPNGRIYKFPKLFVIEFMVANSQVQDKK